MSERSECPGCYADLLEIDGPTHRYIGASPACWAIYTRFLVGDPPAPTSRWRPLLVDSYAAQHPGGNTPQATQSTAVHLVVLTAILEREHPLDEAVDLRRAAVEAGRVDGGYPKLDPVPDRWELNLVAVTGSPTVGRAVLVDRYVEDVLERWTGLHGSAIQDWYRKAVG